jgi:hypothetical protein
MLSYPQVPNCALDDKVLLLLGSAMASEGPNMLTVLKLYLITGEVFAVAGLCCEARAQRSIRATGSLVLASVVITLVVMTWPRAFLGR